MNDPRVGLAAGTKNTAGVAAKNMRLCLVHRRKPPAFDSARGLTYHQLRPRLPRQLRLSGQFQRLQHLGRSNPAAAGADEHHGLSRLTRATRRSYGNLLFISAESGRSRTDCGMQGVQDGQRPRARRSHLRCERSAQSETDQEHSDVPRLAHPHDRAAPDRQEHGVHLRRRSSACAIHRGSRLLGRHRRGKSEHRAVPHRHHSRAAAAIRTGRGGIGYARIFEDLPRSPGRGGVPRIPPQPRQGAAVVAAAVRPGCHDLTSYPAINIVAGSCGSFGILLDVKNPEKPVRLDAKSDLNFSLWHTAVFSNNGKRVVFTDEWGGGTAPALPHHGSAPSRRQHDPEHRSERQDDAARLLQDAGGADRDRRTAYRTTAD